MRMWAMIGLAALIMGAGLMAGCIDEVADPTLEFNVMDVALNNSSPNPSSVDAGSGYQFLYVKVRLVNLNEKADLTVVPGSFAVDDNSTVEKRGDHMATLDMRRIDSIRVDPQDEKIFWVTFKVPTDSKMIFIRYRGTLDEPVERTLPEY
ncbi:MAG: DUF4352 domain-containing protein [Candidatus Thermoplasmatota archaeon]|nr:DUF4352 domain-containing protein [Candidatus Thermoplasmatota archaeon]